jgi:hypothetical protein
VTRSVFGPTSTRLSGLEVAAVKKYRYEDVDGLKVFYREARHADASALLLLHGFPSASHMFRDLIPLLARSPLLILGALGVGV